MKTFNPLYIFMDACRVTRGILEMIMARQRNNEARNLSSCRSFSKPVMA